MEVLTLLCLIVHSAQAVLLDIPDEARMIKGTSVYTLFTNKRTWKNAREICRLAGGFLMNVDTDKKYNILTELENQYSDFNTPWIGLYWSPDVDMHNDGQGCPPPTISSTFYWKSENEALYKSGELCYRQNSGLENKPCREKNTFICEAYKENGCPMDIEDAAVFDVGIISQPTLYDCAVLCNRTIGCFLTGAVNATYCGMLLSPDVSNSSISIKNCPYELERNSTFFSEVVEDEDNPIDCIVVPEDQENYTIGCPNIVEQITETVNVTVIQTDIVTDYVTQTVETTIIETVPNSVPTTVHTTQHLTITTTEQLITTQATTITPSNIVTTVIQPTTITLDASTVMSTVTDTVSQFIPTTVFLTQQIIVTTTEPFQATQVVSTVLQPTTITIDATTVVVSTVTETPPVCPTFKTFTYSVPCTGGNLLSAGASICVKTSVIQTSFDSRGFLDPDGVLKTNICHDVIVVTPDEAATEKAVSSIIKDLTVEKSNISAIYNKKNSAPDPRPSSTAIGYFGIILFSLPFVILLAMDGISLLAKTKQFGLLPRQK